MAIINRKQNLKWLCIINNTYFNINFVQHLQLSHYELGQKLNCFPETVVPGKRAIFNNRIGWYD